MSESDAPVPPSSLPGCGMAAYTVLLMGFGLVGVVGMVLTTLSMLQAAGEVGPSELLPGTQVAVWQMKSMRSAKVVGLTEKPLAWHDESGRLDASAACALMDDRLLRVEDEGAKSWVLRYADIEAVDVQDNGVEGHVISARGVDPDGAPTEITCRFAMNEGGPKMGRMLDSEFRRAHGGTAPGAAPPADGASPEGGQGGGAQVDPDHGGDADLGDGADDAPQGGGEGGL